MRVLCAMSGGVDSSVAALLCREAGHEVVGATMKLWGGRSDSGCCSVADVVDARRVADRLGIDHFVFNFSESFEANVVAPYVEAHARGETPNPCVECNRHLKFDAFLERARRLGFDAIATGHHARIAKADGKTQLCRGVDRAKDQSYVLGVLTERQLDRVLLPVGELQKREVRELAAARGLVTATKPDSQEVCFIPSRRASGGREGFLAERMALHAGTVLDDASGEQLGEVRAVELVTIGQRKGLPTDGGVAPRFVVSVDIEHRQVRVGPRDALLTSALLLERRTWVHGPVPEGTSVQVQLAAHGAAHPARVTPAGVEFVEPVRRAAPGQIAALYRGEVVLGSGVVR